MRDIEELARLAVDCGFKIHKELGPGLLESIYEAVLAASLARRGLSVERQKSIEIESTDRLAPVHSKQLLTYLRLAKQPLGLLMNFSCETFREGVKRVVNNHASFAPSRLCVNQTEYLQVTKPGEDS